MALLIWETASPTLPPMIWSLSKNRGTLLGLSGRFPSRGAQWQVACSRIYGPEPGQGSLEAKLTRSQHHIYSRSSPAPRSASLSPGPVKVLPLKSPGFQTWLCPLATRQAGWVISALRPSFLIRTVGPCHLPHWRRCVWVPPRAWVEGLLTS